MVAAKPVVLGPVIDGLRIIRSGLVPADRVVIAGMQGATAGSKVDAHTGSITPDRSIPTPDATAPIAAQATFAAR